MANMYVAPGDTVTARHDTIDTADTDMANCMQYITGIPNSIITGDVNAHSTLWHSGKRHIPVGKIRNTDKFLPQDIRNKIRQRNWTSKNTPQHPSMPELNGEISTLMGTDKTEVWREHVEKPWDHRKNTNTYWNTIHGLAHKRPPQQDNNSITFKDNTHVDPRDIASAFSERFIDTVPHGTSTTNGKTAGKVRRLQPTQMDITAEQVQTAVKNSGNGSSTGPDGINIKHLRSIGGNGLQYLAGIYNSAINDNRIPHVWELANIMPIPKPYKDINIGTSCRPISLLSVIAEALERVILPYITQNMPNIPAQHGFKAKHSTGTALHNISNTVATGFNRPFHPHAPSQ